MRDHSNRSKSTRMLKVSNKIKPKHQVECQVWAVCQEWEEVCQEWVVECQIWMRWWTILRSSKWWITLRSDKWLSSTHKEVVLLIWMQWCRIHRCKKWWGNLAKAVECLEWEGQLVSKQPLQILLTMKSLKSQVSFNSKKLSKTLEGWLLTFGLLLVLHAWDSNLPLREPVTLTKIRTLLSVQLKQDRTERQLLLTKSRVFLNSILFWMGRKAPNLWELTHRSSLKHWQCSNQLWVARHLSTWEWNSSNSSQWINCQSVLRVKAKSIKWRTLSRNLPSSLRRMCHLLPS